MDRKYDVLLFDADGTLLDFDRSEHTAMEKVFARHGYPYSDTARSIPSFGETMSRTRFSSPSSI